MITSKSVRKCTKGTMIDWLCLVAVEIALWLCSHHIRRLNLRTDAQFGFILLFALLRSPFFTVSRYKPYIFYFFKIPILNPISRNCDNLDRQIYPLCGTVVCIVQCV